MSRQIQGEWTQRRCSLKILEVFIYNRCLSQNTQTDNGESRGKALGGSEGPNSYGIQFTQSIHVPCCYP